MFGIKHKDFILGPKRKARWGCLIHRVMRYSKVSKARRSGQREASKLDCLRRLLPKAHKSVQITIITTDQSEGSRQCPLSSFVSRFPGLSSRLVSSVSKSLSCMPGCMPTAEQENKQP